MKRLVVLVTGLDGSQKKWQPLIERLHKEEMLAGSDFLVFDHCGFWSPGALKKCFTESIESLALDLKAKIERCIIASPEPYDDIICIGHSFGGLIVRHAYLLAAGAYEGMPKSDIPWTDKVSRFVLIAATNRGFEPEGFWASTAVAILSMMGAMPILKDALKGAAFVTNLRISWIRHFSNPKNQKVIMIQLLGTKDTVVKREDSIDLQQFPNGVQFDVPEAGHDDLYRPAKRYAWQRGAQAGEAWELRYSLLQWAVVQYDAKQTSTLPAFLSEKISISPLKKAKEEGTDRKSVV